MKAELEHFGHTITKKDYFKHQQNRKLQEEDKAYLKELMSINASVRNIAECLSQKTGKEYNRQDVHNLMKKIVDDKETITAEAVLGNLKDNGGNVLYSRDDCSCVDVLFF